MKKNIKRIRKYNYYFNFLLLSCLFAACTPSDDRGSSGQEQTQKQGKNEQASKKEQSGQTSRQSGQSGQASNGTSGSPTNVGQFNSPSTAPRSAEPTSNVQSASSIPSRAASEQRSVLNQDQATALCAGAQRIYQFVPAPFFPNAAPASVSIPAPPPSSDWSGYAAQANYYANLGLQRELERVRYANTEGIKASLKSTQNPNRFSALGPNVTLNPADYSRLSLQFMCERKPQGQISLPPAGQSADAMSGGWRPDLKRYTPSLPIYPADLLERRISPVEVAAQGTDRFAHLEAVEKILKGMSELVNSKSDMSQNSGYYLEHEFQRRKLLNDQDLIPDLPGVDYTGLRFATPLKKREGLELRAGMNTVLMVQSAVLHECRGAGGEGAEGCEFLGLHLDRMQAGLLVADRLSASGKAEQYEQVMSTVRPYLNSLKGFAKGILTQGAAVGGGIAAAAILPATVTVGAAVAVLTYVVYEGVKAITESDAGVMGIIKAKWQSFIEADPETQGQIVGELTADVTGLILGGPLAKGTEHVVQKGIGMLLHRTAAREMVLAAEGAGSVTAELGTTLKEFVDLAPESASNILKGSPAEKWSEALPSLSQKSVDGLASLQKVAPDVAETFLKQGADEALSFGQTLIELAEGTGKAPDKVIKGVLDSAGGKVLQTIRKEGVVPSDEGYTLFNKTSKLSNPVPENGIFARVVPQEVASKIKSGEIPLGKLNVHGEVFVAAYDDINGLHPSELSQRLGLFADKAGTIPVDTSKFTVLKFKFTGDTSLLASPVEFGIQRGHGFLPGGKTSGEAREWIMDSNLNQRKMIEFIE